MVNSYSKQYKPWRKGKGGTGGSKDKYPLNEKVVGSVMNKGRSLKNQVRSKEKFLSRLTRKQSENESQNDKGMIEKTKQLIETVKIEIEKLKHQIKEKEDIEREKKIAIKYHQVKFFERKKLTRMEKQTCSKLEEAKQAADFDDINKLTLELEQICMEQLYVAFYPKHKKYISIFGNGSARIQDNDAETRKQRIDIKKNLLTKFKNGDIDKSLIKKKSWVNYDVLKKKGFDLSLAELSVDPSSTNNKRNHDDMDSKDKEDFNCTINASKKRKITKQKSLAKKENVNDVNLKSDSDSSSSSSDSEDNSSDEEDEKVDKMSRMPKSTELTSEINPKKKIHNDEDSDNKDCSSDSSSDSSSSSDDSSSGSSSDDSSSDSSNSDSDDETSNMKSNETIYQETKNGEESEDDFLIDDTEQNDVKEVFAKASREALSYQDMPNEKRKGDKSKGWKTQRQQAGEWKGDRYHKKFI